MRPGDAFYIPKGEEHRGFAADDEPVRLITIVLPCAILNELPTGKRTRATVRECPLDQYAIGTVLAMHVDWPYEFPGAYWLDEQEEQAVVDVLRHGSLFRYYGLGEAKYADAYEAAAREFYGVALCLGHQQRHRRPDRVAGGAGDRARLRGDSAGVHVGGQRGRGGPGQRHSRALRSRRQPVHGPGRSGEEDHAPDQADPARSTWPAAPATWTPSWPWPASTTFPCWKTAPSAMAARSAARSVGTFGDMGIFSLQLNKNMTCGEGGLLITNDEKLYYRAFSAHDMGLVRKDGRLATPEPYAIAWGGGRRMTELCGAVASVQIKKLPQIVDHMRASNNRIKAMLSGTPGLGFRRLNDAEGDTGTFLILMLDDEQQGRWPPWRR